MGYFTNHFSLNINGLTRSMAFCTKVFGFISASYLTPPISLACMGISRSSKSGMGAQTVYKMVSEENNRHGRLEMPRLGLTRQSNIPGPPAWTSTLNHIGIIAPDARKTQCMTGMVRQIYERGRSTNADL